jgi:hypothetical protein
MGSWLKPFIFDDAYKFGRYSLLSFICWHSDLYNPHVSFWRSFVLYDPAEVEGVDAHVGPFGLPVNERPLLLGRWW